MPNMDAYSTQVNSSGVEPTEGEIGRALERALVSLAEDRRSEFTRNVTLIIRTNATRGRLKNFTGGKPALVPDYVHRVADRYAQLHGYLEDLQSKKSTEAWRPLFVRMQTWAYNFMLRKGLTPLSEVQIWAAECATDAALTIISAHFPYDTDFDPWAHVVVQNVCRKFIHRQTRKSAISPNASLELDDELENVRNPAAVDPAGFSDASHELLRALEALAPARRQVIEMMYFEELPALEVAQRLGKSVGAIYSLHFNALHDLRKILRETGDTVNE